MLLKLLVFLGLIYVALCVLAWLYQDRMLYFPSGPPRGTPADERLEYEEVALTAADGTKLHAWWLPLAGPAGDGGAVIVCHGNAGNIEHRLSLATALQELGLSVLLFDYRGYGKSEGRPTEKGLALDAEAALAWMLERCPAERVVLYGESLGGAVALNLARGRTLGAVMVESSFTSVADVGTHHYPLLPVRLISRARFDNLDALTQLRAPLLVIHSPQDEIVPFAMGRALFDAAPGEPGKKEFLATTGSHNWGGFRLKVEWKEKVRAFLRAALGAGGP